jgi:hypothetical protein
MASDHGDVRDVCEIVKGTLGSCAKISHYLTAHPGRLYLGTYPTVPETTSTHVYFSVDDELRYEKYHVMIVL